MRKTDRIAELSRRPLPEGLTELSGRVVDGDGVDKLRSPANAIRTSAGPRQQGFSESLPRGRADRGCKMHLSQNKWQRMGWAPGGPGPQGSEKLNEHASEEGPSHHQTDTRNKIIDIAERNIKTLQK